MLAAALTPVTYAAGSVTLLAVTALLAWGAWRLREGLLPEWSGAPARLAETVIVLAVVIGLAQILGTFGAFRRGPMLAACIAAGVLMGVTGRRMTPQPQPRAEKPPSRLPREELVAAVAATALVTAQWATHVGDAVRRGMTHADTLWYHAPYAADLAQSGRFTGLLDRNDVIQAYYPLNSNVVHALVTMPFERDVLSPFVNIGWAALALLAAWCIGRRRGVAGLSLLAAVVVLGLPMLGATQPGQASNDVAVSALLLAAIALLGEARLAPVPTALAGIAAGLAVGTKLTVLTPVAVLTVGVIVLALRARRAVTAVAWTAAVAVFGSFWYVRNWVDVGNPLPWFDIHLGPLSLPKSVVDTGDTVAAQLPEGWSWMRYIAFPGLTRAVGRDWPLVLALTLVSIVFAVAHRRGGLERLVGLALLGGVVAYTLTPSTGGLSFKFNLRYLTPVLLAGFALLPLAVAGAGVKWRRIVCVLLLGLAALNALAPHRERIPAWPSNEILVAVVAGVGVLVAAALVGRLRRRADGIRVVARLGVLLIAVGVVIGWPLQRFYLHHRYMHAGLHSDAIYAYFRDVHHADVVVYGNVEDYPFYGLDLSNRITRGEGPTSVPGADPCRQFREVVAGKYRYVVREAYVESLVTPVSPPAAWLEHDPAVTAVLRVGGSVVYRVDGPLRSVPCASSR